MLDLYVILAPAVVVNLPGCELLAANLCISA